MAPRAGLLVRRGSERLFIPATTARHLVPLPRVTRVPWESFHMALVGGEVVAVMDLGEPSGMLVLCEWHGQSVALSGLAAESAGFWEESGEGVRVDGLHVPMLDLHAEFSRFHANARHEKESAR